MTAALGIAAFQVVIGEGGGNPSAISQAFGCLASVLVFALASVICFFILRYRKHAKHPGKDKPEVTSIRSQGKTIVNAPPDDDDDTGSVN